MKPDGKTIFCEKAEKFDGDDAIDVVIDHPDYGKISFTARANDVEAHGQDIYQRALAGEFGAVKSRGKKPVK